MNQYTQRTVPGFVDVMGVASTSAVVTVRDAAHAELPVPVTRQDDYLYTAYSVSNTTTAFTNSLEITAVINPSGTNDPDIVETVTRSAFVPKTPEVFDYDDDGNLLSDGRFSYAWNGENRLVSVSNASILIEYKYDYQGRMFERTADGVQHDYLWDGWNVISETSLGAINVFTWGLDLSGSLQGTGGAGGLVSANLGGTNVFYSSDANGNVTDLVGTDGSVVAQYDYDSFGNLLINQEIVSGNPFKFSTKLWEPETGLLHYELRPYFPNIGRWVQRDPVGHLGGLNEYGFVRNNPISNHDKLGLYTIRDAWNSLSKKGVEPAIPGYWNGSVGMYVPPQYSKQQIFNEWLVLEKNDAGWLKNIPDCPDKICMNKSEPVSCSNGQWCELKNDSLVRKFHPGADYCMRSKEFRGSAQQCCYKRSRDGNWLLLLKSGKKAGTPDRKAAGGVVETLYNFLTGTGHYGHDVSTYNLADDLNRVSDYLEVRPPSQGGGKCYE